jgi:hypothetical protein
MCLAPGQFIRMELLHYTSMPHLSSHVRLYRGHQYARMAWRHWTVSRSSQFCCLKWAAVHVLAANFDLQHWPYIQLSDILFLVRTTVMYSFRLLKAFLFCQVAVWVAKNVVSKYCLFVWSAHYIHTVYFNNSTCVIRCVITLHDCTWHGRGYVPLAPLPLNWVVHIWMCFSAYMVRHTRQNIKTPGSAVHVPQPNLTHDILPILLYFLRITVMKGIQTLCMGQCLLYLTKSIKAKNEAFQRF